VVDCLGSEPRPAQSQTAGMRRLPGVKVKLASPGGGESGLCPDFASYTLAFALQVVKNHGKTSVRGKAIAA